MTSPFRPRYYLPGLMSAIAPLPKIEPVTSPLATAGNGPLAGYTNTYRLNLVNFDWITWHNYEWENWIVVDALLNVAIGFLNIKGFWKADTAYNAGESVFDPTDPRKLYLCLAGHTSGTDFEADKLIYWKLVDQAKPPVSSVFGRIGDVVAVEADYAAFYALKGPTETTLADHETRIASAETDINTLETANQALVTRVSTAETDIDALEASQAAQDANINQLAVAISDLDAATYSKTEIDASQGAQDVVIATKLTQAQVDARVIAVGDPRYTRYVGAWAAGTYTTWQIVTHNKATWLANKTTTQEPSKTATDWVAFGGAGGASITIGATPPVAPDPGDLWYRDIDPVGLFMFYVDADSSQWIAVAGGLPPQIASEAEAQAGTNNTKMMTPFLTRQVIASVIIAQFDFSGQQVYDFDVPSDCYGFEYDFFGIVPSVDGKPLYMQFGAAAGIVAGPTDYKSVQFYNSPTDVPQAATVSGAAFNLTSNLSNAAGAGQNHGFGRCIGFNMPAPRQAHFTGSTMGVVTIPSVYEQKADASGRTVPQRVWTRARFGAEAGVVINGGSTTIRGLLK